MNIPTIEYEQKRNVFDFCNWINKKLRDLEREPNFETIYYERLGENWKKLLEEAVPISHFGLYLYREWLEISVQCFADNRNYDAVIEIQNPSLSELLPESIKVEITTTEDTESSMRRQALSRNGYVDLTGTITRDKREIISEGAFVDIEQECTKIVQLILERIERKLKNTYDDKTAILVYVVAHQKLYHRHRNIIIEKIKFILKERNPELYGIFVCYKNNYGIDGVINFPCYDFAT